MNKVIYTNNAPEPIGPYSQAIQNNSMLFLSGQLPIDPKTGIIESDNIEHQTKQIFKNIYEILSKANLSFINVVKVTIFLTNLENFKIINKIYSDYFNGDSPPARSTVEVSALPLNSLVEIEMIAINEN
ncbi:MAG: Rid family detoxifying hydrolase [Pontiellaceae bacterium]